MPTAGPAPTISRASAPAASSSLEAVFGTDADEAQPAQQPDATPDAPVVAELPDVPATDTSAPEVPVDTWVTQGSASLAAAPETLTTPKG